MRRGLLFRAFLVQRGMTLGVRVIAFDPDGRLVLVRHGYTPGWHLPGGGVDYHETLEEAALRELAEETGYQCDGPVTMRGVCYNGSHWKGDHVGVFVVHRVIKRREVKPSFEIAEAGAFALDALPEGTTPATYKRLAEWRAGVPPAATWNA